MTAINLDNNLHSLDCFYQLKNLTNGSTYLDINIGNSGLGGLLPLERRLINGPEIPEIPKIPKCEDFEGYACTSEDVRFSL